MKLKVILLLLAVASSTNSSSIKFEIVNDFIKDNQLRISIILTCNNSILYIQDIRNLTTQFKIQNVENNEFDYEKVFNSYNGDLGIIYDLDCKNTNKFLPEISSRWMFNSSYNWLLFSTDLENSIKALQTQNINIDAEITLVINNNDLYDIYNPCSFKHEALKIIPKGLWNKEFGLQINLTESKIRRRSNFNGIKLKSVVIANYMPPGDDLLYYIDGNNDLELDTMNRFHYHLYKILMWKHNFSVSISRTDAWGLYNNGTWDGVSKQVISGGQSLNFVIILAGDLVPNLCPNFGILQPLL